MLLWTDRLTVIEGWNAREFGQTKNSQTKMRLFFFECLILRNQCKTSFHCNSSWYYRPNSNAIEANSFYVIIDLNWSEAILITFYWVQEKERPKNIAAAVKMQKFSSIEGVTLLACYKRKLKVNFQPSSLKILVLMNPANGKNISF